MKISYVYKLTSKVTGKYYFGSRTVAKAGLDPLDDLGVYYFSSSAVISSEFKNAPGLFEREIIFTHASREEVCVVEKSYTDIAVSDPMSYNMFSWPETINPIKLGKLGGSGLQARVRVDVELQNAQREWSKKGARVAASIAHSKKDENGKSLHGLKLAQDLNRRIHLAKDDKGKSIHSVMVNKKIHSAKNPEGKSISAVNAGTHTKMKHINDLEFSEKTRVDNSERLKARHQLRLENGKSAIAVVGGKASKLNNKLLEARMVGEAHPFWPAYLRQQEGIKANAERAKPFREECKALCRILGIKLDVHPVSGADKFQARLSELKALLAERTPAKEGYSQELQHGPGR